MTSAELHLKKFRKELHSGISSLVLLSLLAQAGREMYGYEIAKALGSRVGGASFLKQGAIYPVLRSLHAGGLLSSRVEMSVSGPPRRYYAISPDGHAALQHWRETWAELRDLVDALTALPGTFGPEGNARHE